MDARFLTRKNSELCQGAETQMHDVARTSDDIRVILYGLRKRNCTLLRTLLRLFFFGPRLRDSPTFFPQAHVGWHRPQDVLAEERVHEWAMMSPMPVAEALWRHLHGLDGLRDNDAFGACHPLFPYDML